MGGGEEVRGKGRANATAQNKAPSREASRSGGKDKADGGVIFATDTDEEEGEQRKVEEEPDLGPLVVLACRHMYHQVCLERVQVEDVSDGVVQDGREFRCPIDG